MHRLFKKRRIIALIAVVLLFSVARLMCLRGLLFPVRIASGSMADALLGRRYELVCSDCRFPFCCDAQYPPPGGFAVCPNCGYGRNVLRDDQVRRGQRVLIDRLAFALRDPMRWELVAFRDPHDPSKLSVKRVVGLPKEQIAIRQGDLYVNGQIQRKSLVQQHAVRILVHDNFHQPAPGKPLPARWQSENPRSGWRANQDGFVFVSRHPGEGQPIAGADLSDSIDWLTYRHWRCYAGQGRRSEEFPVLDNYGYNQGVSRELQEVTDLTLSCRLTLQGGGLVALLVHDGRQSFRAELVPDRGEATLKRSGKPLITEKIRAPITGSEIGVEFSVCDRQVVFAVDGRVVIQHAYQPTDGPFQPTSRPLAIGAAGLTVSIGELKVFRDVYYLDANRTGWDWSMGRPLDVDEFLVLGDNPPISDDSRLWANPGLQRKSVLGKVLSPFQ